MTNFKDLQPWLDYFDMLTKYQRHGLLEVRPEKGEAYITQAAFHTLSGDTDKENTTSVQQQIQALQRIYVYTSWLNTSDRLLPVFALHVVNNDEPHDLLYTIIVSRRRKWWHPWTLSNHYDFINYKE